MTSQAISSAMLSSVIPETPRCPRFGFPVHRSGHWPHFSDRGHIPEDGFWSTVFV